MRESRRLPESELDIMLVVWKEGGAATAPAILTGLERPLTASALHSYLKRLEEKGFLTCVKSGKVNTYTALISQADYQRSEGSLTRFAAALYDEGPVDQQEIAQLQALLEELRGEAR